MKRVSKNNLFDIFDIVCYIFFVLIVKIWFVRKKNFIKKLEWSLNKQIKSNGECNRQRWKIQNLKYVLFAFYKLKLGKSLFNPICIWKSLAKRLFLFIFVIQFRPLHLSENRYNYCKKILIIAY